MPEFRKVLTIEEIRSGNLHWTEIQDAELKKVFPQALVFDLLWEEKRIDHLAVEWEHRRLHIGDPILQAQEGAEIILSSSDKNTTVVQATILEPVDSIIIRKRLSLNEFKHRYLKWFAREDDLYRRLISNSEALNVEIGGKVTPGRQADFEKRTLTIGEALRMFSPGDMLLLHRSRATDVPTLVITREATQTNIATDATTSLRSLITRLISRPLNEFNEGEVKGLVALLDENKRLWERLTNLREENDKLKEQVATLENVYDQFSKNTFFGSKRDFDEWVINHITVFEKGIRILHRDYAVTWEDGKKRRVDLLCQDRKGLLVAVEIVFNPVVEDLESTLRMMIWLKRNIDSLGRELTNGKLQANSIRGMVISNREKPDLVEICLQNSIKLCMVNSGYLIDIIE